MIKNNFIIRTTIFPENADNPETAYEIEVETDTLDDKPTLTDILGYAKSFQCSGILCVNVTIEDINGDYIDHDEFFVSVDLESNTITIVEEA